jgi:plastocyanin
VSPANQTLLARFAVAVSVFALLMVGVVAARGSDGGGGGEATDVAAPVSVALSEFAISPASITVPLGGQIAITNNGSVDHNVAVLDTAIKSTDLPAGGTETLDLSSLEPGTYELFCAIPGHKDSGMVATLNVTDGSAASAASGSDAAAAGGDHGGSGVDIGTLEATDALAKRIDEEMRSGMDAGVAEFLDFAAKYTEGEMVTGNAPLEPEILPDGTKRFSLTAAITDWQVSPGKVVKAWTYNGIVPGPWIKVDPGDRVRVDLTNKLPISTDIHWHGIDVPNDQDGVAGITQKYIEPNTTFTYEFTVGDEPQLAMYHAHYHGQEAVLNGLFSVIQVGEVELPAPGRYGYFDVPEDIEIAQEIPMVLNDAGVIGLSLNGKAFPETAPVVANKGDWVLIHYYNEGLVGHPMHLHRQPQLVVAKDGFPLEAPYQMDTLWISPGERYSVLVQAEEVGTWAFHCHILNHAESNTGLIGMVTAMVVVDPDAA